MLVTKRQLILPVALLALLLLVALSFKTQAGIARFYAESCLGGWQNPQAAAGEPDGQSAILSDSLSEIFCGNFKGEVPSDGAPKKFQVKFSWLIDDGAEKALGVATSTATTTLVGNDFNEQVTAVLNATTTGPQELTVTNLPIGEASSASTTASTSTPPTVEPPVVPDTSPESTPAPEPTPPTPELTPAPEPVVPPEPASPPAEPSAWWRGLINRVSASDTEPVLEPIVGETATTAAALIAAADESKIISPDDLLEVFYTLDSNNWQSLGKIKRNNWREAALDLPLTSWSDLPKVQISVRSLPRLDKPITVSLDSLWLEVSYDNPFNSELTLEQISLLPRVQVPSQDIFLSPQQYFTAEESPSFTITKDLPKVIATSTEPLVPADTPATSVEATSTFNLPPLALPEKLLNWLRPKWEIKSVLAASLPTSRLLKATVYDSRQQVVNFEPIVEAGPDGINLRLPPRQRALRPGRYRIEVEILQGRRVLISSQDFYWGVLALNANQSIYEPGDTGYLQFAVLSDDGHTICDANLSLDINGPGGQDRLSTAGGTIKKSETCGADNVTDQPDYFAYYRFNQAGTYQLGFTDLDRGRQIKDSLVVRTGDAFVVERVSATRINPFKADYKMRIRMTAREDFSGEVSEQVPSEFQIADGQTTWPVSLRAGETRELSYTYHAPPVSPQIYLLGPAILSEASTTLFTEARQWQIAADNACQSNGTGLWSAAGSWTGCGGTTPQSADTVTIVSPHTITLDTDATITSLTINNGGTLTEDAGGRTLTIAPASGTAFTNNGTFTAASSIVKITSDAAITLLSGSFVGNNAFNKLQLTPAITAARTYTFGAAASTTGNFDINPSKATAGSVLLTVNMNGAITVAATATTTITKTTNTTSKLVTNGQNNLSSGHIDVQTGATLTASSTITLTGSAAGGVLFTRTGTVTLTSSTVIMNPDAFVVLTSGTFSGISANNNFNNLQLTPTLTANQTYTFGSGAVLVNGDLNINPTAATSKGLTVNLGTTLTVAAAKTLTISGASSATSSLNTTTSNYTLSTGLLNIASAGTLAANGSSINITGTTGTLFTRIGIFTEGNGTASSTVTFNGVGTPTLTSGAITFHKLTLDSGEIGGASTYTVGSGDLTVANTLTVAGANALTLSSNGGVIHAQGDVTYTNTSNSTGGAAQIQIDGTGNQALTGPSGTDCGTNYQGQMPAIIVDKASGTLTLGANIISISDSWTYVNGTVDASTNSSIVCFPSTGSVTIDGEGASATMSFYKLTIGAKVGTLTAYLDGDLKVLNNFQIGASGATVSLDPVAGNDIYVGGNWTSNNGTFIPRDSRVFINGGVAQTINTASFFYDLVITKSGGTATLASNVSLTNNLNVTLGTLDISTYTLNLTFSSASVLTVDGGTLNASGGTVSTIGNIAISSGTLSAPTGTLTISGSYNNSGGTFTANSGTVTFDSGATGKTLAGTMTGSSAFYNLNLTNSGTSAGYTFSNNASTTNNFFIGDGTTVVAPALLSVAANWTKDSTGVFTHNSGTVELTGVNQTISGATTFYNLKKNDATNDATSRILTLPSNATTTISGLVTFNGTDDDDRVHLRASTWGTRWGFTVNGTYNINYASTTDSDASLGALITPSNTTDGGNNLNWVFGGSLTIIVDGNTEAFSTVTPGSNSVVATSSILQIKTANSTGFVVTVKRSNGDATMRLTTDTSKTIPDKTNWIPNAATTTPGNATASSTELNTLQFRVRSSGTDTPNYASSWWGSDDTTANARFAGFPNPTAQNIVNRSVAATATTTIYVLYNLAVPSTQASGDYSGDVEYAATVNP